MKRLCVLLGLGACSYDASNDAIWRGTVKRDGGPPLAFAGFDPYPTQGYAFGGGISAMGYLDDDGEKLLVRMQLHFTDRHDFENAKSPAFPITLMITEAANVAGMGIDYFEQPASDSNEHPDRTFNHDFQQHEAGQGSGTVTVTACDYSTFMDGRVQATLLDNDRVPAMRVIDLEFHYNGQK